MSDPKPKPEFPDSNTTNHDDANVPNTSPDPSTTTSASPTAKPASQATESQNQQWIDSYITILQQKLHDVDTTIESMCQLHSLVDKEYSSIMGQIALYQKHVEPKLPKKLQKGDRNDDSWRVTAESEALRDKERKERRDRWRAKLGMSGGAGKDDRVIEEIAEERRESGSLE